MHKHSKSESADWDKVCMSEWVIVSELQIRTGHEILDNSESPMVTSVKL